MPLEIERKYIDVEFEALASRLEDAGAICDGAHFESNFVFDTGDGDLFARGQLLRLRIQEWPDRTRCVLTAKRPGKKKAADLKIRQEDETEVADGMAMAAILDQLGYRVTGRYEKVRTTWLIRSFMEKGKVKIDMDTLPFGNVVEIECDAEIMDAAAATLGLDGYPASTQTYYELGRKWQLSKNMPVANELVFDKMKKKQIRSDLGIPKQNFNAYL